MTWSRAIQGAALIAVGGFLALLAVHSFLPQRNGPIALTEVFEPYLTLATLSIAVLSLTARTRQAAGLVALLVAIVLVRNASVWISLPQSQGAGSVSVAAWNVEAGGDAVSRTVDVVRGLNSDLVALEELQRPLADALRGDPTLASRYPATALAPKSSVLGVGLLSVYPIIETSTSRDPPYLRALVQLPGFAEPAAVYVVHPLPARFEMLAGVPVGLDTSQRDAAIATIRRVIENDLDAGRPVLLMGDLNTTEREPAYAELSRDLADAHLEAGLGPGFTWRPGQLAFLPFGLLRIDYVFAGNGLRPVSSSIECNPSSDHCVVRAEITASGVR